MISPREALVVTAYLHAANYLPNAEGQAEVWSQTISNAAPWATISDLMEACKSVCSEQRPRVTTGDVIAELNRAKAARDRDKRIERQIAARADSFTPLDRGEIAAIFARHGRKAPTWKDNT